MDRARLEYGELNAFDYIVKHAGSLGAQPYFVGVPEDAVALRAQIREEYGFIDPILMQYFAYLGRVLTLDFGQSHYYKESVWTVMFSRIPWSMVLTVSSMVFSILFGIFFGAAAGRKRDKSADKILLWLSGVTTGLCVTLLGATMGIVSACFGKVSAGTILGIINVLLVIPTTPLMMIMSNLSSSYLMIAVFTLIGWCGTARMVRAQILRLINERCAHEKMALLMITHDLGVVREMADRVYVTYCGKIVEQGTVDEILRDPQHPYTKALIDTIPGLDPKVDRFVQIPHNVPHPMRKPQGWYFSNRCGYCTQLCEQQMPPLFDCGNGRKVRCYYNTEELWEKSY